MIVCGENSFPKGAPLCFSLKLGLGPVWLGEKKLGPSLSSSLSVSRSLTSRDTCRYWNDYVPGLCRHPDVHLTIKKKNLEKTFQPPRAPLPCFGCIFLLVFSPGQLGQVVGWRWKLRWSMRDNRLEMILLSLKVSEEDRKIGVKKEVDGKEGWSPARGSCEALPVLSSSALSFPWSVRALGVSTVADTDPALCNLWFNRMFPKFTVMPVICMHCSTNECNHISLVLSHLCRLTDI